MSNCDLIHSEFDANNSPLATKAVITRECTYTPVDLPMLVQRQLCDPFCRQNRECIDEGPHILSEIRGDDFLQRTVHSVHVVVILKFLQPRVVYTAHQAQVDTHSGGQKMFYFLHQHYHLPSMSVEAYHVVKNYTRALANASNFECML